MEGRRLESIYVMPTETTYVVLDEAPTWWYNEVSLPYSRNWSKSYNINLKKKDKEVRLNRNKRIIARKSPRSSATSTKKEDTIEMLKCQVSHHHARPVME
ncbi:hypothetical protein KY290_000281 [Solanum tuberosum]|uniref:Uncharacterized protein n=1 Tax=Solanum tuberosum TaxID=4113 RepID=A0ABQ7WIV4_SOLTU|nr:hypothetical protein KY284_000316 [Solanum tuberosum]KAH0764409.1 hypothetical protein KY285_000280 [Solanum tuberosum]KAH0780683.1 hypothetical protein KY290_000281 [Solanum tuberosum]